MSDPIADLRARFVYRADKSDSWKILDAPTGPLRGDCEDFALTALWLVCDKSKPRMWWWITKGKAVLWRTKTPSGEKHMMLWVRGKGWIDNTHPAFGPRKYPKLVPYVLPAFFMAWLLKG